MHDDTKVSWNDKMSIIQPSQHDLFVEVSLTIVTVITTLNSKLHTFLENIFFGWVFSNYTLTESRISMSPLGKHKTYRTKFIKISRIMMQVNTTIALRPQSCKRLRAKAILKYMLKCSHNMQLSYTVALVLVKHYTLYNQSVIKQDQTSST